MKMAAFWIVAPCSLEEVNVSEVLAASVIRAIIMEAAGNNPEDSHLQIVRSFPQSVQDDTSKYAVTSSSYVLL
jgi:hypothetical protein